MGGASTFPRLTRRFVPLVLSALIGALLVVAPAGAAGAKGDLDQCENGKTGTGTCAVAGDWVNGNLGESKARYMEGDSLPYRLVISDLTPGTTNTVTIEWDTTKGGKHAIDYVTTFNRTIAAANPCAGVSGCNSPTTFPIPTDSNVTGAGVAQIAGNFTMYNGTVTTASAYTRSGTYAGDSSAQITLTFTAASATSVLAWAGHISTRADWGQNASAVGITGSPYHTRLIAVNGSGGNQDRSASAEAIIFPGSITIVKDAQPNAGDDFGFTTTGGLTPATFTLDDDGTATPVSSSQTFANITAFSAPYTITEAATAGWTLSFPNPACTVTSPSSGSQSANAGTRTVSVSLAEGENVTCTFVNSRQAASLVVIKHVVNDNGGTKTAADFPITVTGDNASPASFAGAESPGTTVVLDPGSYSVAEGGDAGYAMSASAGCAGTIAAGETKTCVITNDDIQPQLIVKKHVVNDNGGTAVASDFTLSVTGSGASPASFAGSETGTTVAINAGAYGVTESPVTGYAGTSSADCSGSITVGETKTCTITNDDQTAQLIVIKHVINDNGGIAEADAFTLTVDRPGGQANASVTGAEAPGTMVAVNAGAYSVTETGVVSGYTPSYSADCAGTLALGRTKTCTVTNDDISPQLIVIKHVINDNGGTLDAADFTMNVSGSGVSDPSFPGASGAGTPVAIDAGVYAVTEDPAPGYAGSFSADCAGTIGLGETRTCTVTNDDIVPPPPPAPAQLTVTKVVVNDDGGTGVVGDFDLLVNGNEVTSGSVNLLPAGSYTVSEGAHAGYVSTISGACAANGSITLVAGQTAACTITNNDVAAQNPGPDPGPTNPGTEVESQTATVPPANPTPPLQAVPVPTPAIPAPVTGSTPTTPVNSGQELPRTGAGIREETLLALALMLAGLSALGLGRRRSRQADV